jgi:hypothetical protein
MPQAIIMVGCWVVGLDEAHVAALNETAKADLLCSSLREATKLCIDAATATATTLPVASERAI